MGLESTSSVFFLRKHDAGFEGSRCGSLQKLDVGGEEGVCFSKAWLLVRSRLRGCRCWTQGASLHARPTGGSGTAGFSV